MLLSDQAAVYQHSDSDCRLSSYLTGEDKHTVGLGKKKKKQKTNKKKKLILRHDFPANVKTYLHLHVNRYILSLSTDYYIFFNMSMFK